MHFELSQLLICRFFNGDGLIHGGLIHGEACRWNSENVSNSMGLYTGGGIYMTWEGGL